MQFINEVEKVEKVGDKVYLMIRSLDLSRFPNKKRGEKILRRVQVGRIRELGFMKIVTLNIEYEELDIQVSNRVYKKIQHAT